MTSGEFSTHTEGTTMASTRLNTSRTTSWLRYSGSHSTRSAFPSGRFRASAFRASVFWPRGRPQMRSNAFPSTPPNARIRSWIPFAGMCVPI